jgi:enoyl-[acyl-carrier-protein] reductase (NADH)
MKAKSKADFERIRKLKEELDSFVYSIDYLSDDTFSKMFGGVTKEQAIEHRIERIYSFFE